MKQELRKKATTMVKEKDKKAIEIIDTPTNTSFKLNGMEFEVYKYEIIREGGYPPRLRLEFTLDEEVFDLKVHGKTAY